MEPSAGNLSSPSSSSSSPPPAPESIKRRSGGRRSRTGCWTCRLKKVKCDETRPCCLRCSRLRLLCKYDKAVLDATSTNAKDSPCQALSRQLPQFTNSASSLDLTPADHEAIRYFRTTFARLHHTKNPDYSVYSIIFAVAENQPLVMRMLLAVGGREMESRRPAAQKYAMTNARKPESWASLHHHAAALKSLADTLSEGDNGQELLDLDASFTLLYLMIQYETRYGDAECLGLQNHLKGAAAILNRRCRNIRDQLSVLTMTDPPALASQIPPGAPQLSLYTARVLIWISISDAAAATYGVGGIFNDTLHQLLGCSESTMSSLHSVADGVEVVHTYSNPLFRVMWGPTYPQEELLDDIENRSVFELMLGCFQVRHLLAKVAQASDNADRQYRLDITAATMQAMTTRYSEVLQVAGGLYPSTGSSNRLVRNLRIAAPHYHAVVLLFERFSRELTASKAPIDPKAHCSSIIGLAKQGFRHGGDEAVISVAWPLLVAALEPEGQNHYDWISCRFKAMVRFGPRFGHVYEFLQRYMAVNSNSESSPWLDPGTWFRSNSGRLFVL